MLRFLIGLILLPFALWASFITIYTVVRVVDAVTRHPVSHEITVQHKPSK